MTERWPGIGTVRVRTTLGAVLWWGPRCWRARLPSGAAGDCSPSELEAAARATGHEWSPQPSTAGRPRALGGPEDDAADPGVGRERDGGVQRECRRAAGCGGRRLRSTAELAAPVDAEPLSSSADAVAARDAGGALDHGRPPEESPTRPGRRHELLAVGLPVLLVARRRADLDLVGRALAPVEAIRAEVDEISGRELHRRVPEPPGDDEIARLARTMNRMLDRLEGLNSSSADSLRRLARTALTGCGNPAVRRGRAGPPGPQQRAAARPNGPGRKSAGAAVVSRTCCCSRERTSSSLRRRIEQLDLDDLVFAEGRRLREATGLRIETTAVSGGRVNGDANALGRVLTQPGRQRGQACPNKDGLCAGGDGRLRGTDRRRRRARHPGR